MPRRVTLQDATVQTIFIHGTIETTVWTGNVTDEKSSPFLWFILLSVDILDDPA